MSNIFDVMFYAGWFVIVFVNGCCVLATILFVRWFKYRDYAGEKAVKRIMLACTLGGLAIAYVPQWLAKILF